MKYQIQFVGYIFAILNILKISNFYLNELYFSNYIKSKPSGHAWISFNNNNKNREVNKFAFDSINIFVVTWKYIKGAENETSNYKN